MSDATTLPHDVERLGALARQLTLLRDEMRRRHLDAADVFAKVHPVHRLSAANLVDYLVLRSFDLRDVQEALAEWGLSSLGRSEEHVITTLERVIDNLHVLAGDAARYRTEAAVSFRQGRATLTANAQQLLGDTPANRPVRIMVTMPREAADDYSLVSSLVQGGMDCARINCAHDSAAEWRSMIDNIRAAAMAADRQCRILMDLPGPKLRTGPVSPGPPVVRLAPQRDEWGRIVHAARARLVEERPGDVNADVGSMARIPVDATWLHSLHDGERVDVVDTRGARRRGEVEIVDTREKLIRFSETTYLATGTVLTSSAGHETRIGPLARRARALRLRVGDVLTLTSDVTPVDPQWMRIGCTLPQALRAVRVGHRVFFDDGKIGAVALHRRAGEVDVQITSAAANGSKLRGERGINLPDTDLELSSLPDEDLATLQFVVDHADLVGLSFVNRPEDVDSLRGHLSHLHGQDLGIILKIETVHGFEHLPDLLLATMASERVGVMVARGDLAVECGFERLAEVQEEILWLCEAAHIPVIWATQVLDQMAKTGQPSRAEISDAAMAGRAECVMLNKGPHVVAAVRTLEDILRRMDSVQHKKTSLLRRLESWSSSPQ
jgi:pyruvate kinase